MKIIEQLCGNCGTQINVGDVVCQQCNANVVLYDKAKTYRFMQTSSADYRAEAMQFARKHEAAFVGLSDIGHWIVGPVEMP